MEKKYDIFISYCHEDASDIKKITNLFDQNGIKYWIDSKSIPLGVKYQEAIVYGIESSDIFLFVYSIKSNDSADQIRELGIASQVNKPIIPFMLDDSEWKPELRYMARSNQGIEVWKEGMDFALKVLVNGIRNRQAETRTSFTPSTPEPVKNSLHPQPVVLNNEDAFDLDYDDALDFMQDGDLQEAMHSLQASFENGNGNTILLFNKLLFQNFGKIDWDEETWEFLEQQVNAGHSFAHLAYFYKFQHNKESHRKAVEHLKAALADKKNGYAFLSEGIAKEKGIGMRPNLRSAMKRYEQAYKMGITETGSYLAEMYLNGNSGLEIDANKAKDILKEGCCRNDARSYFILAKQFTPDIPIQGTSDKAIELYQKAISLHLYESYITLGKLYENYLIIDNRFEKALHCYLEAIKHGIKDGHAYIAKLYWKQGRFDEAKNEAEIGEKNNNILSISALGEFYENGIPNMDALIIEHKPDYPKAWYYYQKAFKLGGHINDAISLARLYIKKEYRPENMTWDIIEEYLEEGIKVPIPQAIVLMVDALKQNGREEDAAKYIKLGAENGSLSMMYEYGIRSISSNTGEGLKYLEDSGMKGFEPSIQKLLEYYQMHRNKSEYERWLEIAYTHQIDIPINDYSYYLFKSKKNYLWGFLKEQMKKNKKAALYWMSFYLWRGLSIPSEEIEWLLKEIHDYLEVLVTYNTRIYELYADLLIRYSDESTYNEIIKRVSKIDEYRSFFFSLRKDLSLHPDDYINHFKLARSYAYNLELPDEWKSRFRRLMYMALTTKMRLLIIGENSTCISDLSNLFESESFVCLKMNVGSVNNDTIRLFKPQAIINCTESSSFSEDINKIISEINKPPIIELISKSNIKLSNNSTYDEWAFIEERLIRKLRQNLIILRRKEFGVPPPDFKKCTVINCEDADDNYTLVKIILNNRVVLHRAHNGIEAVTLNEEIKPDLFLMDIRMEEMNGIDAARIIKEVSGDSVSIVALSAYAFDKNIQEALQAGMDDFLIKPFYVQDLIDIVSSTLEIKYILNYLSNIQKNCA